MTEQQTGGLVLSLDPEAINKYMAEQLTKSALGDELKKAIDSKISELNGYGNSSKIFGAILDAYVRKSIEEILDQEKKEEIKEAIRKHLDTKMVENLTGKFLDRIRWYD